MEIILTNKPGKHNYKQKYDLKMRRCPDLNQGSHVYYTGALTILKKKHGEHNYKQKYDMKTWHCPDLNQGSPVY